MAGPVPGGGAAGVAREGWPVPGDGDGDQVLGRRREPPGGWRRFVRPWVDIDATRHLLAGGRGFWVIHIIDDHSRFLLAAHVAAAPAMRPGWEAFRGAVAACGLPRQLISDNGINFTGRLIGQTVAFERQVTAAGTELIHASPGHPQTIGKLERQHDTQNDWIADHPRPRSLPAAQKILDAYRHDYNHRRPHEGIGQQFPAEVYQPDTGVELPAIELAPADPYPPGCAKRKAGKNGFFRYGCVQLGLDIRWAGIEIGLIREYDRLKVYYGAALIDTINVTGIPEPANEGIRRARLS